MPHTVPEWLSAGLFVLAVGYVGVRFLLWIFSKEPPKDW